MVAEKEIAELAEQLICDSALKEAITPEILTMHADRGISKSGEALPAHAVICHSPDSSVPKFARMR
jgi:putative transposase